MNSKTEKSQRGREHVRVGEREKDVFQMKFKARLGRRVA